jgi:putative DNA primase/helicase
MIAAADIARGVRIEDDLARRGFPFWTKPRHNNLGQPCPMCGGVDRFAINTRKQLFNCRGCGGNGDIIDLVKALDTVDFKTAVQTLAGTTSRQVKRARRVPSDAPKKTASEPDDEASSIARARKLWAEAIPINGTLAELYLRVTRGLTITEDLSHVVRFHDRTPWLDESSGNTIRVLGMIAAMRAIDSDEIVAIQKTRLAPDGSKLARKMFGPAGAAAIKIDRDEDVTYGLIVGEGLETCLAARELGFRPCWALGSAGAIERFPVLAGIDALALLAETDDGGANARAVDVCGQRWHDAKREVIVVWPKVGNDINDAFREVVAR